MIEDNFVHIFSVLKISYLIEEGLWHDLPLVYSSRILYHILFSFQSYFLVNMYMMSLILDL